MMGNVLGLGVGAALSCEVVGEALGFVVWDSQALSSPSRSLMLSLSLKISQPLSLKR